MEKRFCAFILILSFSYTISSFPTFPTLTPLSLSTRAPTGDPLDFSWIKKWAAIGDSYAAGIGAGKSLGAGSCSRYDASYPSYLNGENGFGSGGRDFDFLACSGAKSPQILEKQVSTMKDGDYDVITVSAGGNDVGFFDIVNQCVFTFYRIPVFHSCQKSLDAAKARISNELPGNIDKLLSSLKPKLKSGGKIYYTGYPKFFGTDDRQCDGVSWFVWKNMPPAVVLLWREFLTLERRQAMNDLVDQVNKGLKDAIQRAGGDVVFIDYDQYFQKFQGRFCEVGAPETDATRNDLLFFEWNTVEPGEDGGILKRAGEPVPEGSFEGDIAEAVQNTTNEYPDIQFAPENTDPVTPAPGPGRGPERGADVIDWLIPDSVKRIFHPRPVGYQIIGNLVLWHIADDRGKALGYSMTGENIDIGQGTCPARGKLTCGGKSANSAPARFVLNKADDPHQRQATPRDLLYRLRQVLCTGACEAPQGVKDSITLVYPQKGATDECEISIALDGDEEIYAYRTTAPRDSQWQQCWDATADIIDKCVNNDPNTGWVNGPHDFQFYQMGFRPKNDQGAKHAPFQVTDFLGSGSPVCSSDCGPGGSKKDRCQGGPFDGIKCCGPKDGGCGSNGCEGANGICTAEWKGCPCNGGKSAPTGDPSDCQRDCCSTILDLGWCELNCKSVFNTPHGTCLS